MKIKRFLSVFLLCACLTGLFLTPAASALDIPDIQAKAALLVDVNTDAVAYAKNIHEKNYPASLTKIMTCLLALENGNLSDVVTVSSSALDGLDADSSVAGLQIGEQMTLENLLYCMMVVSGNDAAVALGEHIAGSEDAFVERMNRRAQELGMNDTHFVNCTGLPADGHLTSAYDIAVMSRELLLNHPDIRQFTTIWMDSLRGGESMLVNTNKLIRFYDGATGLKTGSTDTAKNCLSASAERNGMELIAVVLKAPTSTDRFEDAKALLNYGFSNYALVTVTPEAALTPLPVRLGERAFVQPVLTKENRLLLDKARSVNLTQTLDLPESVDAPVCEGDPLGELVITDADGVTVASLPILAGESVGHVTWWQMLQRYLAVAFGAA